MSAHVAAVCRGGCYQLRPLERCVTDEAIKTLTPAFISSWLYYCNILYCDIAEGLLSRLQSGQNAAVRLVTGLGQREHITPVLQQLHWLLSTCDVQVGDVGLPLTCRNCTGLPVQRVPPHFICWSALSAFSWLPDMIVYLVAHTMVTICSLFSHCWF